jgi:hypothetical protein
LWARQSTQLSWPCLRARYVSLTSTPACFVTAGTDAPALAAHRPPPIHMLAPACAAGLVELDLTGCTPVCLSSRLLSVSPHVCLSSRLLSVSPHVYCPVYPPLERQSLRIKCGCYCPVYPPLGRQSLAYPTLSLPWFSGRASACLGASTCTKVSLVPPPLWFVSQGSDQGCRVVACFFSLDSHVRLVA